MALFDMETEIFSFLGRDIENRSRELLTIILGNLAAKRVSRGFIKKVQVEINSSSAVCPALIPPPAAAL